MQQKERILVVDPNDLILGLFERWLGEAGYAVIARSSQNLARTVDEAGDPHLVIIDVPRPRSAEKMVKFVRQLYASPILLLSARFRGGASGSLAVARQLGVAGVLPKPFTRDELLSAVRQSVEGR